MEEIPEVASSESWANASLTFILNGEFILSSGYDHLTKEFFFSVLQYSHSIDWLYIYNFVVIKTDVSILLEEANSLHVAIKALQMQQC
jgi:hypothetical protein